MQRIAPFLWFDGQAEPAARFYVSIFPNSQIRQILRYGEAGREQHGQTPGTVMTVAFELDGLSFTALNGGPHFRFTEAVSFVVECATQEEIDHYWNALGMDGDPAAQMCGWLKDRYGLSWQIVPRELGKLLGGDAERSGRVMQALLQMKKLDIAALQRAYDRA